MTNLPIIRWLAISWTAIILVGCLIPHEHVPTTLITWNDKFQHVFLFTVFSFFWIRAGLPMNTVVIAGTGWGGLIEVLQYLLPINRSADWRDLAADFLGTILGVGLALGLKQVIKLYERPIADQE